MIRKFIVVVLGALFAHSLINILFFDVVPNNDIIVASLLTSIYLLARLMFAILYVEHLTWLVQNQGKDDA